ncbi:NAD(P)-binding protein [Xylaria intraflava]|nr:NAD(P)-binding protein [Xylaria intraflava]
MASGNVSTWLVTGASAGFGQAISMAALTAGHRVIGGTRDVAKAEAANPGFTAKGGIWMQLDPSHPSAFDQFSKGQGGYDIDVLVNNAGYAFVGGVEDGSEADVREQMDINFWGPLRAVQAVLPSMREKRRGNIVLISSGTVYSCRPARGAYSASKAAIEAMHEVLQKEIESFGIKVLIVEPGTFKTTMALNLKSSAAHESTNGFSEGYKGTVLDQWVGIMRNSSKVPLLPNRVMGDPDKAANAILKAVVEGHDYLRMVLGADCLKAMELKLGELHHDLEATREIALSMTSETA